jgi:hypothetical protein
MSGRRLKTSGLEFRDRGLSCVANIKQTRYGTMVTVITPDDALG